MDYEILYKCEAEQNIKCYVCKANLKDYIVRGTTRNSKKFIS